MSKRKEIKDFLAWLFKYYKKNKFIPQDANDWAFYLALLSLVLSLMSLVLKGFGF